MSAEPPSLVINGNPSFEISKGDGKEIVLQTKVSDKRKYLELSSQKLTKSNDKCKCLKCKSHNRCYPIFQYNLRYFILSKAWFRFIILLAIIANCIIIALDSPANNDNISHNFFHKTEIIFFIIFVIEMILKMLGYGLFTKPKGIKSQLIKQSSLRSISSININSPTSNESSNSLTNININDIDYYIDPNCYIGYFKDPWNILDFIIVLSSFGIFFKVNNITVIRVLRVLRPLRTVTRIKELKVLITTIILSLKELANVSLLLMFLFTVYAIIGIRILFIYVSV